VSQSHRSCHSRENHWSETIRRYLATLSSLFSFAGRSGWLVQNPAAQFDKRSLPEAQPRTRFLSQAEYRLLLAASELHLKPILEMAIETGMRSEELLGLRWDQVHMERREVRLVVTKSNRPRVIPLSDKAVAVLAAIARIAASPDVFTNPQTGRRYRNLMHSFRKLVPEQVSQTSVGTTYATLLQVGMFNRAPTSIASAAS
jgi:integrase